MLAGIPEHVNGQQKASEGGEECPITKIMLRDGDEFEEIDTEYLNQIYPENLTKATLSQGVEFHFHFLSCSLHYWVELTETKPAQTNKLSLKDMQYITDLLNNSTEDTIKRWSKQFNQQARFNDVSKKENDWRMPGKMVKTYERAGQQFEIWECRGDDQQFIAYKERFEVLLLFFVDGANYTESDPYWHYLTAVRKDGDKRHFVGCLSKYEFHITADRQRDRISQVLVLPPYQKQGHGKEMLDIIYEESLKNPEVFEVTVEGPSFQFQCLRDFKECQMLIKQKLLLPPKCQLKDEDDLKKCRSDMLRPETLRQIKEKTKLPGHQIERITNIFIYSRILQPEDDMIRAVFEQSMRQKLIYDRSAFKSRKRRPQLHIQNEQVDIKHILLQRSKEQLLRNRVVIEDIMKEDLDGYRRVINKLNKLSLI